MHCRHLFNDIVAQSRTPGNNRQNVKSLSQAFLTCQIPSLAPVQGTWYNEKAGTDCKSEACTDDFSLHNIWIGSSSRQRFWQFLRITQTAEKERAK